MYVKRIKEIREALGLSVPKLAERINIKSRTIVSYEAGRVPSLEFLAQLHKVYKVNLNWFVSGEGEMFMQDKVTAPALTEQRIKELFNELMAEKGLI